MAVSTCDWRIYIRGLAVIDVIIAFVSIIFGIVSLHYLYDKRFTKDSNGTLMWTIFATIVAYLFLLLIQKWLALKLLLATSLGAESSITVTWSTLWRHFNLFHIGCYIMFLCLNSLWAPDDAKVIVFIVLLICYRLACYTVAYYFLKDLEQIEKVEIGTKSKTDINAFSGLVDTPPINLLFSPELKPTIWEVV